jgi:hypothetical protein
MHIRLNREAVRDSTPDFFDLLRAEGHPAVQVALGILSLSISTPISAATGARGGSHERNDGGGRLSWTVIPLSERETYMAALEKASVLETSGLRGLLCQACQGSPGRFAVAWDPDLSHQR